MADIDIFGIKFNTGESKNKEKYISSEKTYEVPKEILLEKLGFDGEEVTFIQYDYKAKILTVKTKSKK